jgi:hypothetical protein
VEEIAYYCLFLSAGGVLGFLAFRVCRSMEWHWSIAVVAGLIPLAGSLFCGLYGLMGSALFVGGLYKATTRIGRR